MMEVGDQIVNWYILQRVMGVVALLCREIEDPLEQEV